MRVYFLLTVPVCLGPHAASTPAFITAGPPAEGVAPLWDVNISLVAEEKKTDFLRKFLVIGNF